MSFADDLKFMKADTPYACRSIRRCCDVFKSTGSIKRPRVDYRSIRPGILRFLSPRKNLDLLIPAFYEPSTFHDHERRERSGRRGEKGGGTRNRLPGLEDKVCPSVV